MPLQWIFIPFDLHSAAFFTAFCTKIHCVLHQNTLRFAPNCIAFCTKLHCVLHQNALRFAPKRTVFSTKMHRILHQNAMNFAENNPKPAANCGFMQCAFILYAFTTNPFLHQNQPSRESIICARVNVW